MTPKPPSEAAMHSGETARRLVAGRLCESAACREGMPWCSACEDQICDIREALDAFAAQAIEAERDACAEIAIAMTILNPDNDPVPVKSAFSMRADIYEAIRARGGKP